MSIRSGPNVDIMDANIRTFLFKHLADEAANVVSAEEHLNDCLEAEEVQRRKVCAIRSAVRAMGVDPNGAEALETSGSE